MSEPMKVDSILAQIRSLRQQSGINPAAETTPTTPLDGAPRLEFSELLSKSLNGVNATQAQASQLAGAFERGDPNVSITEVMVNMQKAQVSFKAAVEVRNKVVEAYKEVMRMSM